MHETKRWIYLLGLEGFFFFLSVIVSNLYQSLTHQSLRVKRRCNSRTDQRYVRYKVYLSHKHNIITGMGNLAGMQRHAQQTASTFSAIQTTAALKTPAWFY